MLGHRNFGHSAYRLREKKCLLCGSPTGVGCLQRTGDFQSTLSVYTREALPEEKGTPRGAAPDSALRGARPLCLVHSGAREKDPVQSRKVAGLRRVNDNN